MATRLSARCVALRAALGRRRRRPGGALRRQGAVVARGRDRRWPAVLLAPPAPAARAAAAPSAGGGAGGQRPAAAGTGGDRAAAGAGRRGSGGTGGQPAAAAAAVGDRPPSAGAGGQRRQPAARRRRRHAGHRRRRRARSRAHHRVVHAGRASRPASCWPCATPRARGCRCRWTPSGRAVFVLPALKAGRQAPASPLDGPPDGAPRRVTATREADGVSVERGAAQRCCSATRCRASCRAGVGAGLPARRLPAPDLHPGRRAGHRRLPRRSPPPPRHLVGLGAHHLRGARHRLLEHGRRHAPRSTSMRWPRTWDGPVHGGLRSQAGARRRWRAARPRPRSTRRGCVTVYRTHDGGAPPYFLFDLDSTQEAASASPVMLDQYIYGGFALRGHAAWGGSGGAASSPRRGARAATATAPTPAGATSAAGSTASRRATRCWATPSNFRAPQPVRINPTDPFFSIAPVRAERLHHRRRASPTSAATGSWSATAPPTRRCSIACGTTTPARPRRSWQP